MRKDTRWIILKRILQEVVSVRGLDSSSSRHVTRAVVNVLKSWAELYGVT
jgi:hypothetical protein